MQTQETGRTIVLIFLAAMGGAWIGYADSRSDDVFITLGLLAGFSFLLGLAGPSRPWLWAPCVAVWIPALDALIPRLGLAPGRPGESFSLPSALAVTGLVMVVSFAGAFMGSMIVWMARHAWSGAAGSAGNVSGHSH